jgi:hypothetical protein
MSDASTLVARRNDLEDAEIEAAAVELGCFHWVEQANRVLVRVLQENHRLTLLLEEREETIAALLAKPRSHLSIVREESIPIPEWAEVKR